MMPGGYAGKILRVDLGKRQITEQVFNEAVLRKYLGGGGLAARILWDETDAKTDPLSPQNRLMFMVGPLTGAVPSSSRYIVAGLSPLTNVWGMATSGGAWARELKRVGLDGIVFSGKADKPVYLWLRDGTAEIRDAGHLRGKDTFQTNDLLKAETDASASVACIGPAGERLVRFASVMADGAAARAAARCGLGAVMGSKNLKAVVVHGSHSPTLHDPEGLKASIARNYPNTRVDPKDWRHHFEIHRKTHWQKGRVLIKNCASGEFEGFLQKLIDAMAGGEPFYCATCRYSCNESAMIGGRRRQVYESIAPLGSMCLVDDTEALQEAYDLCNKYGMDSQSAGGVIAFAMECFDKGLIGKKETEDIDLDWGNAKAMLQTVKAIGEREGFGRLLGEGVRITAERIGGLAHEYAIHVKGLEFPGHDPRSNNILALEYATDNRGACHLSARGSHLGGWTCPELGFSDNQESIENRFRVDGRGELTARMQNYYSVLNSLTVCLFLVGGTRAATVSKEGSLVKTIMPRTFLDWLNLATGWDMTLPEMLETGERIYTLQRMINVRRGISRKDDTLPPRILTHPRNDGSEASTNLPPLGPMLHQYYTYRGWTEEGIPTKQTLARLGLG